MSRIDPRDILFFVGLVCVSLALGILNGPAIGLLTLGGAAMIVAIAAAWPDKGDR